LSTQKPGHWAEPALPPKQGMKARNPREATESTPPTPAGMAARATGTKGPAAGFLMRMAIVAGSDLNPARTCSEHRSPQLPAGCRGTKLAVARFLGFRNCPPSKDQG